MPPHGRRRLAPLTVIVALFFLFTYTASAASAVLGIDLGTEYIKAALVKPGIPLDIVLTKDSKRKESAALAFKSSRSKSDTTSFPERIYGGDALAIHPRFPGDVYPNLKPLLGLQYDSNDIVAGYQAKYPGLRAVQWKERGTVGFQSPSFSDTDEPFLVEELLAMELKNIRGNAVALAGKGSSIKDAVVTIPPFYTAEEKSAVTLAAELAGLRVLCLISDGLSVGVNYATSRTFPSINEGAKPEVHLVYDMGAGSATATVLKFQGRTVKDVGKYNKTVQEVHVLGTGWDRTLGGDSLNQIIVDDMIAKFGDLPKVKTLGGDIEQVKAHGRTMAKLWKEAERSRQVLSANTETSSSFEGLFYEEVNFKYKLTRADYEKLASAHANRVEQPIKEALSSAKLGISDLESVILHGGAVRTPFIQKQLESLVGNPEKLRTNVNSDEAAVFGAAFKAAGISPSFRVKDIRASDSAGYAVGLKWSAEGKERQQKLFVPTSQVGAEKQVPFKITEDFAFGLYEQVRSASGELIDNPVLNVQTKNMTASVEQLVDKFSCAKADINTNFVIRLSPIDGLPEVVKGSVSCETTTQKGGVVDGVKDFFGFGSKKGEQEPLKDDKEGESVASSSSAEGTPTSSPKENKASESSTAEDPKETKKRTETIHISFSTEAVGLPPPSTEQLQRIKDRLIAFDSSDKSRLRREEALNTLEAFTYKARDLLDDEGFVAASTEKERTEIEEQFKGASEWLYGDGADATREVLKERLDGLHGLVDPIKKRQEEASSRPASVKALQEALNQTKAMISVVKQQREAQSMAAEASLSAAAEPSSQTTAAPSSTDDGFGDLDDEPDTSSSTTTTATPDVPPILSYSEEELKEVTDAQDSVQAWLDEKLAAQEKLSPTESPVLLSSELLAKSKELNALVMKLITRQMNTPPKSKPKPKVKSAKTKSSKKGKTSLSPDDILKDMPDATKITDEQISEAIAQQKSKASESKGKEAKATGKHEGKAKVEHGEL